MNPFLLIGLGLTLFAAALVAVPLMREHQRRHALAAMAAVVAIPVTVVVIYGMVSNHEWQAAATAAPASSGTAEAGSLEEAVGGLEEKLRANPADEEGWLLLGSSYLNLGRPADAIRAYERALGLSKGSNSVARLNLAEAQVVLDPAALTGPAGQEIETILATEPRNPKALWYGGLRAMAVGQMDVARSRWTTLLELNPPERVRQIIQQQLADLAPGAAAPGSAPAAAEPTSAAGAGTVAIQVQVSVSPELAAQVRADAPLFVFVRDPARPGPPMAVVRRRAGELPLALRITDADLMLPGSSLASLGQAKLVARIALGGDPVAKPGDMFGEAAWAQGQAGPQAVVINQVVGP